MCSYDNKQLLHTPPLNTMNYLHKVVEIFTTEGRSWYSIWRGVCNNSFIIYTLKNYGKEIRKRKKKSELAGFELGAVGL